MKTNEGFTRIELLAVLAAIGLLSALGVSVLASTAVRNDIAVCANNLRQVGRAFRMWASDHGGENPWTVSYTDGGCYIRPSGPLPPGGILNVPGAGPVPAGARNNAWFHFAFVSQELRTPEPLVCPTDRTKVRARTFSNNSTDGYFFIGMRDRATSYIIGPHAVSQAPWSMLSGDRTLKEDFVNSTCSANLGTVSGISLVPRPPPASFSGWNPGLHPNGGNLLSNDGRAEFISATGLYTYLGATFEENGSLHYLKPN